MLSEEQAAERLRLHGILPTQQRLQIAQLLLTRDQHVSAEQVLELVNATGHSVSKATVYNTLGLFAEKGILREVNVDPSRAFFNIDTGELSDIPPCRVPVDQLPAAPSGTVVDTVEVIIRVRSVARTTP
jgi:Fur family iron response transcriptional regulator